MPVNLLSSALVFLCHSSEVLAKATQLSGKDQRQ